MKQSHHDYLGRPAPRNSAAFRGVLRSRGSVVSPRDVDRAACPSNYEDPRSAEPPPGWDEPTISRLDNGKFVAELDGVSSGPCRCVNEALHYLQANIDHRRAVEAEFEARRAELGEDLDAFEDEDIPF